MLHIQYEKLEPIFHSEISSSYLIFQIFENHNDICVAFLQSFLKISSPINNLEIKRERRYLEKGSIDLFFCFLSNGVQHNVLLEVKVHDYLSGTTDQIGRYIQAAIALDPHSTTHFIYLTQFTEDSLKLLNSACTPKTIFEHQRARMLKLPCTLLHISWPEFYKFLDPFLSSLSSEEELMLDLQIGWMNAKSQNDLVKFKANTGNRTMSYYFKNIDIEKIKPFGDILTQKKRIALKIKLMGLSFDELNLLKNLIVEIFQADEIDKTIVSPTEPATLKATEVFLAGLSTDFNKWKLLGFYSTLFERAANTKYLLLNGRGDSGLSIKAYIKGERSISLCRFFLKNHEIVIYLSR